MSKQPASRHPFRNKAIIAFVVVSIILAWGINSRIDAASKLKDHTEEQVIPSVHVVKAASGTATEDVILPGTVQAWHEAPIFSRTNGYVKNWKADIGTQVKAGDVLAVIETPEVDAQLRQAEADLATSEANGKFAQSTAGRWQALLKTNSVSKQETDEKISDASAKKAATASARANLDRLKQLESFKRVTAPFDGVITARNIDTGSLINAGSGNAGGAEMFHVADVAKLRAYVEVPQTYTPMVKPELKAELHFSEHPGKNFDGKLIDTSHALNPTTHTLLVQFEIDNKNGELMPGGYVEAHLKLPAQEGSIRLPVNTLIFRSDGLQTAVVDANGIAQLKTIKLGRDFGKEVEVLSGITAGDSIIINPSDSLTSGQKVKILEPEKTDDKKPEEKKS